MKLGSKKAPTARSHWHGIDWDLLQGCFTKRLQWHGYGYYIYIYIIIHTYTHTYNQASIEITVRLPGQVQISGGRDVEASAKVEVAGRKVRF